MAKTRAQRKAERRKREARQAAGRSTASREQEAKAQHRTQVPESADVLEAELAEQGADLETLTETELEEAAPPPPAEEVLEAPAPSRADVGRPEPVPERISRRARRAEERERKRRAKEFERRQRQAVEAPRERQRGPVIGFLVSCWAELKRVQWPSRETLIQASAVTFTFIGIAALYLGALDAVFSWLVNHIL